MYKSIKIEKPKVSKTLIKIFKCQIASANSSCKEFENDGQLNIYFYYLLANLFWNRLKVNFIIEIKGKLNRYLV